METNLIIGIGSMVSAVIVILFWKRTAGSGQRGRDLHPELTPEVQGWSLFVFGGLMFVFGAVWLMVTLVM